MQETASLRGLRDRPFELLAELERRGRAVTASATTDSVQAGEWVGVALRMAGELYLVAREEAREVLGVPAPLTRVPGAKSWILGLANIRGQLLPMIDLRAYLGKRSDADRAQLASDRGQSPRHTGWSDRG